MSTSTYFHLSIAPLDALIRIGPSAPPAELCLDLGLVWSNAPAASKQSTYTERLSDDPPETRDHGDSGYFDKEGKL
jgi:hypothetical protein